MRILLLQSVSLKCSDAGKIILVLKVSTIVTLSVTDIHCKCIGMSELETLEDCYDSVLWLRSKCSFHFFNVKYVMSFENHYSSSKQWVEIFPLFVCPFNWTWPGPIIWPLVSSGHTPAQDPALSRSWHTYGWLPSNLLLLLAVILRTVLQKLAKTSSQLRICRKSLVWQVPQKYIV